MILYNWKKLDVFYKDVLTFYNYNVKNNISLYTNRFYKDNQKKIKEHIENKQENSITLFFGNYELTVQYILFCINDNDENKWLFTDGIIEYSNITIPSAFFFYNLDANDNFAIEKNMYSMNSCKNMLLNETNMYKICNICNEPAEYTCLHCDNFDYCETCHQNLTHKHVVMKKIENNLSEISNLCDTCGKKIATYNYNTYFLCDSCYVNNPHDEHEMTKINNTNLLSTKDAMENIEKILYFHYVMKFFSKIKKNLFDTFINEDDNITIFNNNSIVFSFLVEQMHISKNILKQLCEIEKKQVIFVDNVIRKYYCKYDILSLFKAKYNLFTFNSDSCVNKFYYNAINLIKTCEKKENIVIEI